MPNLNIEEPMSGQLLWVLFCRVFQRSWLQFFQQQLGTVTMKAPFTPFFERKKNMSISLKFFNKKYEKKIPTYLKWNFRVEPWYHGLLYWTPLQLQKILCGPVRHSTSQLHLSSSLEDKVLQNHCHLTWTHLPWAIA